jgi:hypothetical protein
MDITDINYQVVMNEARGWIRDTFGNWQLSDEQVEGVMDRQYQGGMRQFVADIQILLTEP